MASDTPATTEYIILAEKDVSAATIIRPDLASDLVVDAAIYLRRSLESKVGIDFTLKTDWLPPGEDVTEDTVEIVLGATNRSDDPKTSACRRASDAPREKSWCRHTCHCRKSR